MNSFPVNHWKDHARQWSHVGQPLRPGPEDVAFTHAAIREWLRTSGRTDPTLLVLGVTPELCGLPLNGNSRVVAVDSSTEMISALWRESARPNASVICADWRSIPLADGSINLVLADGSFSALSYPSGYVGLGSELRRLLRPGGRCIIRCFAQLEKPEVIGDVFTDLTRGRIGNFHILKWRLVMALQPNLEAGVSVGSVWQALDDEWKDRDLLAQQFGWPTAEVRTIENYRNVETRYTFPTLAQYREFFSSIGFAIINLTTPSYELGERCPTLVLERL